MADIKTPQSLAVMIASCELESEFQHGTSSALRSAYIHYTAEHQKIFDSNISQFMTIELGLDPRIGVISKEHKEVEEARKLVIAATMTGIKEDSKEASDRLESAYKNSPAKLTETQILQALNQDRERIKSLWNEIKNSTTKAASSDVTTRQSVVR